MFLEFRTEFGVKRFEGFGFAEAFAVGWIDGEQARRIRGRRHQRIHIALLDEDVRRESGGRDVVPRGLHGARIGIETVKGRQLSQSVGAPLPRFGDQFGPQGRVMAAPA